MLSIDGLDFRYGEASSESSTLLFNNLKLTVTAGEHVVIVGDSGGGKSTLLKLIGDQANPQVKLEPESRVTMVMQEGALLDHLSVIENLNLISRYTPAEPEPAKSSELLESLNIGSSLHHARISQLSGGQMRRVAVARALVTSPNIVLFDEPDAGLDLVNLIDLANTVRPLSSLSQKACITVSHNPFYIAQVATKVYRLQAGALTLIADWPLVAVSQYEQRARQMLLQDALSVVVDEKRSGTLSKPERDWPVLHCLSGAEKTIKSLFHLPRSWRDELRIAWITVYLSLITGLIFYALVGLMLGATTIAVVRMLADSSLTGLVSMFIKPADLIELMGGRYVLYLAPAIGGMLFVARSGSIMSNWLGEMVRGRQVQALIYLGVPESQLLRAPSALALAFSMMITILWFAVCVWYGGVIATQELFNIPNALDVMWLSKYDIERSLIVYKALIYSALASITITALGLAAKKTAHQVNIHTTKTIIYATLCIAFAELMIILT